MLPTEPSARAVRYQAKFGSRRRSAGRRRRRTASVAPGARSAIQYAAAASTRNGTRSQIVQRTRKGSLRASPSVYGAANRHGRNQPIVITAGIAPITTLGAPSHAANAGRMVDGEAKASATMNSA